MISVETIDKAHGRISEVVKETPLQYNESLSDEYKCSIYLKREDMQSVRSFKIRGAYNKMKMLTDDQIKNGVVCASAGNHAQGVAFSCAKLKIKGTIYMPDPTPNQKISKVKQFGKEWIDIVLVGDTYDDAYESAVKASNSQNMTFVHPFNDLDVMAGQGTIAKEMIEQSDAPFDILIVAVGGGGLLSGVGSYFKLKSPNTEIIGVEAEGSAALAASMIESKRVRLEKIDRFADGIAVKEIGSITYDIIKEVMSSNVTVHEGAISSSILKLYNEEAIVAEPAGAVSIAALEQLKDRIRGKTVGVILCGGNNDVYRTQEITERALLYEGKKHYFIVQFPQRAGALRDFLEVLGPNDDIARFEYTKKSKKESGPALVGIEVQDHADFESLIQRMKENSINFQHINDNPVLFAMLV